MVAEILPSLVFCPCSSQLLLDIIFSDSWSNSVQLEIPYVCPNGLIRVLSETPPPFLTPPEVRLPDPLYETICSPRGSLQPSLPLPSLIYTLTLWFVHK